MTEPGMQATAAGRSALDTSAAADPHPISKVPTKSAKEENFPVGSWLLPRHLRPHIATYYAFARAVDDIADDPDRSPDRKVAELNAMEAVLNGAPPRSPDQEKAARLRRSLSETGVPLSHGADLCVAFRLDAVKSRTESWAALMTYCRYSAAPVGRYLLDLHGESRESWPASDALCAALQVINHLQDCRQDYLTMDRVYIPADRLAAAGLTADCLAEDRTGPALRRVMDEMLDGVDRLNRLARSLPGRIRDRRMRMEAAVIVEISVRLAARLRREDPLATRVELGRSAKLGCLVRGAIRGAIRGLR